MTADKKPDPAPIRWRCRRGMLELDHMFITFFDNGFSELPTSEQHLFERMLEEPDPDLFAWLMGHETPENKDYKMLIAKIKTTL